MNNNNKYKLCKFKYNTMKYNKQPMSCDAQLAFGDNYRGKCSGNFLRGGEICPMGCPVGNCSE